MRAKIAKRLLLIFLGLVFIFSAWSKLLSIDNFEIYVYGLGFLSLSQTFVLCRLLVGFELLLGACLVFSVFLRPVLIAGMLSLAGFSLFLFYLLLRNKTEHCHCFGELIQMSHGLSLVKNILLMLGMFFLFRKPPPSLTFSRVLLPIFICVSFVITFIFFPPDNFHFLTKEKAVSYSERSLQAYLKTNESLNEGRKVLVFIGTGCKYCKLISKKLSVMSTKAQNTQDVRYAVWGTEESMQEFFKQTQSTPFAYSFLPVGEFLRITDGKMPLCLMLENGIVKQRYNYRNLDEQALISFLLGR